MVKTILIFLVCFSSTAFSKMEPDCDALDQQSEIKLCAAICDENGACKKIQSEADHNMDAICDCFQPLKYEGKMEDLLYNCVNSPSCAESCINLSSSSDQDYMPYNCSISLETGEEKKGHRHLCACARSVERGVSGYDDPKG